MVWIFRFPFVRDELDYFLILLIFFGFFPYGFDDYVYFCGFLYVLVRVEVLFCLIFYYFMALVCLSLSLCTPRLFRDFSNFLVRLKRCLFFIISCLVFPYGSDEWDYFAWRAVFSRTSLSHRFFVIFRYVCAYVLLCTRWSLGNLPLTSYEFMLVSYLFWEYIFHCIHRIRAYSWLSVSFIFLVRVWSQIFLNLLLFWGTFSTSLHSELNSCGSLIYLFF